MEVYEDDSEDKASAVTLKIIAAVVLFLEVIVGGLVPVIVGRFEKLNVLHSLLNTFSGGIFMGAGSLYFELFALAEWYQNLKMSSKNVP